MVGIAFLFMFCGSGSGSGSGDGNGIGIGGGDMLDHPRREGVVFVHETQVALEAGGCVRGRFGGLEHAEGVGG